MCTLVISCSDTPLVFEPSKHIFELVVLFIQDFAGDLRPFRGGMQGVMPLAFRARRYSLAIEPCRFLLVQAISPTCLK